MNDEIIEILDSPIKVEEIEDIMDSNVEQIVDSTEFVFEKRSKPNLLRPPSPRTNIKSSSRSGLPKIYLGQPFSKAEEIMILQYIMDHKAYVRLRSMDFWEEVALFFGNGRTRESLRERFRNYIIPSIHKFDISGEERNSITVGFNQTYRPRRVAPSRRSKYLLNL